MWNPTLQSSAPRYFHTHTHTERDAGPHKDNQTRSTIHTTSCGQICGCDSVLQKNHYKTDGSWMRMRNIDTQNTCLLLLQTQTSIKTPIDQSASRFTYYYAHTSHKKQHQVTRNSCRQLSHPSTTRRPSELNIHDYCRASLWLVNWCVSEINVSVSRCGYSLKIPVQTSLSVSACADECWRRRFLKCCSCGLSFHATYIFWSINH